MKVIVGGIIEKEGKVLLVQEKQEECYGKWKKDTTQVGNVGGRKICWQRLLDKLNLRGLVRIML